LKLQAKENYENLVSPLDFNNMEDDTIEFVDKIGFSTFDESLR
jgi:hypothetical protein